MRKSDPGGKGHPNYVGMTGTSPNTRGMSHLKDIRAGNQQNVMAKHIKEIHSGKSQSFTMKSMASSRTVLGRCKGEEYRKAAGWIIPKP